MALNTIIASIAFIALIFEILVDYKRDLMMLQQNSYRPERYGKWLSSSGDTTSYRRLGALAVLFFTLSTFSRPWISMALAALLAIFSIIYLFSQKYKKPLVWTARAKRIYFLTIVVTLAIISVVEILFCNGAIENSLYLGSICLLGCMAGSYIIVQISNWCLKPVENAIGQRYINEAKVMLKQMPDLKVIGITGSYGKTSTKHYLSHILETQYDTLITPGSYNTTMGVVRTVREMLKPYNEVFIVEMGAKKPGDIKEICDIVKPEIGIITAVGPQHLESFKSIERVQATKFELADSLPSNGVAIVNDDFEFVANREVNNSSCVRYAINSANADFRATDISYSSNGTSFTVEGPDGFSLKLNTQLMGECNVSNLLGAVTAAHLMGVPDAKIAAAVASIQPVEHRLSIKRTPAGVTILDDAFNSNPVGSKMALKTLGTFKNGRRIVITPGMIELGDKQYEANYELGRYIAQNTDIAIIVGQYNRDPLSAGIKDGEYPGTIVLKDTFNEAQEYLSTIVKSGDTVLYENDLPDTFK